jgi:two-component system sensor histidine kinase TctE
LLALSRADAVSASTQPLERVDIETLCESILAQYLDAAAERRIDLGLESRPAQVRGHAWLLRELIINLVDNAIRYTPEGGRVTLRCGQGATPAGERVWIEVEDDGPGIPLEERDRVLQRLTACQARGAKARDWVWPSRTRSRGRTRPASS